MFYGYARVSTKGQARDGNGLVAQEQALISAGATEVFSDTFTGTTTARPELDRLLSVVQSGDTIIVTKLDRIARNVREGLDLIQSLLDRGVAVHVLNMGLIDDTPNGRLIVTILLAFAEFERDLIVQRMQEGREIAKARDERLTDGRPKSYTSYQAQTVLKMLDSGDSIRLVARNMGMSKSTVARIKQKAGVSA